MNWKPANNSFMGQNSWIPNSYRITRIKESSSVGLRKKNSKITKLNHNALVRKIIPLTSPEEFKLINKISVDIVEPESKIDRQATKSVKRVLMETTNKSVELSWSGLENYSLIELLGKGSYATVYLARAINRDNQQVAVKVFDTQKKSKSMKEEIDILKRLTHPNVVSFIDEFVSNNKQYIVLEKANGTSLLKSLKAIRKYSEIDARSIFTDILRGVEYLHCNNIAHRDLKLENIIIDKDKGIKIIDFGFATMCKPEDKGNVFWGTPSYMSPEIVNHKLHNYMKADIWALGIILFALLTGKFPFKAQTDKDLYK